MAGDYEFVTLVRGTSPRFVDIYEWVMSQMNESCSI